MNKANCLFFNLIPHCHPVVLQPLKNFLSPFSLSSLHLKGVLQINFFCLSRIPLFLFKVLNFKNRFKSGPHWMATAPCLIFHSKKDEWMSQCILIPLKTQQTLVFFQRSKLPLVNKMKLHYLRCDQIKV